MSNDRLVLVQHDISGVIVELPERHLAHPVLGAHYKIVKTKGGKPVVGLGGEARTEDAEPDADTEPLQIEDAGNKPQIEEKK